MKKGVIDDIITTDDNRRKGLKFFKSLGDFMKIGVSFNLEGKDFAKEYIWEKLQLDPSCFRTKNDWPEAILKWEMYNPNIPDRYKPRTVWKLNTGYADCLEVEKQLTKLLCMLNGKEEVINQLCKELNLCATFAVSIRKTEDECFPEMYLSKKVMESITKMNADLLFCITVLIVIIDISKYKVMSMK